MLGTACSSAHGHFPVAMGKGDGNTHFPPAAVGKLIELRIEMDATFAATTNKSVKGRTEGSVPRDRPFGSSSRRK